MNRTTTPHEADFCLSRPNSSVYTTETGRICPDCSQPQLKAACGSGGTAKDGVIEVQGDHVATVMAALTKLGYAVKRSGG